MRKLVVALMIIGSFTFTTAIASASFIYFSPVNQTFSTGDTLFYDLYADIDAGDAIMGFGFDLSFDGGATYVSGPGDSGLSLTIDSFACNPALFEYDPLYDDGDTINGWRPFGEGDVSGIGIHLGTFQFSAHALMSETITLGADSLGPLGVEGLVQGKLGGEAFLPNTPAASASPVPEPSTFVLFSFGLIGIVGFRKRIMP